MAYPRARGFSLVRRISRQLFREGLSYFALMLTFHPAASHLICGPLQAVVFPAFFCWFALRVRRRRWVWGPSWWVPFHTPLRLMRWADRAAGCPLLHSDSMKLPVAALLLIATSLIAQDASHTTPHRHATKTMTTASYAPDFFIDTHADTTQRMLDEHYDLSDPLNGGHVNFEAAKKGKLGAEFFSIWVEPQLYQGHYARRTLELIDAVAAGGLKHPDKMMMAYSVADIERAHREHKLAALMGIEGGHSIENSLGLLRDYYTLGVRYMTLTWSNSNDWADSSGDYQRPQVHHTKEGLTEFGKDVVYEMNRLGMMVDISHVADKTFYRTLILTRAPVIASHSSARALTNHRGI